MRFGVFVRTDGPWFLRDLAATAEEAEYARRHWNWRLNCGYEGKPYNPRRAEIQVCDFQVLTNIAKAG